MMAVTATAIGSVFLFLVLLLVIGAVHAVKDYSGAGRLGVLGGSLPVKASHLPGASEHHWHLHGTQPAGHHRDGGSLSGGFPVGASSERRRRLRLTAAARSGSNDGVERRTTTSSTDGRQQTNVDLAASQKRSLVALSSSWKVSGWSFGGKGYPSACEAWSGVACNNQGFVTALNLSQSSLSGSIPKPIAALTALTAIDLFYNQLSGSLPFDYFSNMTALQYLSLNSAGSFDTSTGQLSAMKALQHLDLSFTYVPLSNLETLSAISHLSYIDFTYTKINGPLPTSWGLLTDLQYIGLKGQGEITGDMQSLEWMSALTNLQHLTLRETKMEGNLPTVLTCLQKLSHLDLAYQYLTSYPMWITELPLLEYIDLTFPFWTHPLRASIYLPQDLSRLERLNTYIAGHNSFFGAIFDSWGTLTRLTKLVLNDNQISGFIPKTFGNLTNLHYLDLSVNNIKDPLPDLSNLTTLESLNLASNNISGSIPASLARITTVTTLDLSDNKFIGGIPWQFARLTGIRSLQMSGNQLNESLSTVARMTFLEQVSLGNNPFNQPFPRMFSRLTKLTSLGLSGCGLSGSFPTILSNLKQLANLDLGYNKLQGELPPAISKLEGLQQLNLAYNGFSGVLPPTVASISGLVYLVLNNNDFKGSFPSSFFSSTSLQDIFLQDNQLDGPLPNFDLWRNSSVRFMNLGNNGFTGPVPKSITSLTALYALSLANNSISGPFPAAVANMTSLSNLWLSSNNLIGTLPDVFHQLSGLEQLLLDRNSFNGSLPSSMCNMRALVVLDLSSNKFYGEMPSCIYQLKSLNLLDVSNNNFYGELSQGFKGLQPGDGQVNVGNNYFYGLPTLVGNGTQFCPDNIPRNLSLDQANLATRPPNAVDFKAMETAQANLRNNCLSSISNSQCMATGQRNDSSCFSFCGTSVVELSPSLSSSSSPSFISQPCDGHGECLPSWAFPPSDLPPDSPAFLCNCSKGYYRLMVNGSSTCSLTPPASGGLSTGALVAIIVSSCLAAAFISVLIMWLLRPKQRRRLWTDLDVCTEYSLAEIEAATNKWDKEGLLGEGAFGQVYKGTSSKGVPWAVKRSFVMSNDFEVEVRAIASLNHRNLVRLYGFCLHLDMATGKQEQILVYEFVDHGDLSKHFSCETLTFAQVLKISLGAAEGLSYLHNQPEPIVHRDIKPQNILVTGDYDAKVADFGLLKRITEMEGEAKTRVAGTPGYVDPDYRRTNVVTAKSDVYCFGIVLLQLLSGKKPTVKVNAAGNKNQHIVPWATAMVQLFDLQQLVRPKMDASEDQIIAFADLALDCVKTPGPRRPDMKEVVRRLSTMMAELYALKEESMSAMSGLTRTTANEGGGGSHASSSSGSNGTGTRSGTRTSGTGTSGVIKTSSRTSSENETMTEDLDQLSMGAELQLLEMQNYK